jgi:TPR repeat protein
LGAHGKIFISYRREDAPGDARGICDRLGRSFGEANVFMDVDRLLAGQRFDRQLDKALAQCDVLVAVIGSRWMELLSGYVQSGKRDYVRDEIAAALQRDIIVIPVMTGREANMPPLPLTENLPENIRDLVMYQKHNIAHETFRRDAADLVAALKSVLRDKRGPRPWRAIAVTAVVALALIGASAGYWMDMLPQIRPRALPGDVAKSSTIAALSSSDTASKKAEEEARRRDEEARKKAGADAKAADDAARKAVDDAARKQAADEDAARKAAEQARIAVVTDCDRLAAWPYDDERPRSVAGVLEFTKIDSAATAACDDAMRRYPDITRFVYQAGRAGLQRKDYPKALELLRTASSKGSVASLFAIGVIYANGFGVAQDYAEARKWYEQAAARGNSPAMNNLGQLYENGQGVTQDYTEAGRWFEKGMALGNPIAMTSLGELYENGRGVAQDYAVARKWYEQATALGSPVGMRHLGVLYANGRGVTKDYQQARNWYEKAAALGDTPWND